MARAAGTYAVFDISEGKIVCKLFEADAPKTVANFVELAEGKRDWSDRISKNAGPGPLYNGTVFHRVIPKLHDPGRRSQRHRDGRAGLPVRG